MKNITNRPIWNSIESAVKEYDVTAFQKSVKGLNRYHLNNVLLYIVKQNHYPFVERLGLAGFDFSFMESRCLLEAIHLGSCEMANALIEYDGCKPTDKGILQHAAYVGWASGIDTFFKCGLKPMADHGEAFLTACICNYYNVVEVMLKHYKPYAKIRNSSGAKYAIINNNEAMLKLLLDNGAKMNNDHLMTAHRISNDRITEIVEKAIE